MPPKEDKDKDSKEDMDRKYSTVLDKLEVLAKRKSENDSKINEILKQTSDLQEKISELGSVVTELKPSLSFMNESVESLQKEMKDKVDTQVLADFKEEIVKKIDDLENRSKRNNLMFWNIPEGEERHWLCESYTINSSHSYEDYWS